MTAILLLMACGVLTGIPAALLVFATNSRFCGGDDNDDGDERSEPESDAIGLLRSRATQAELYAYMVGEVAR